VVITGTGFVNGRKVNFGGLPATDVVVTSNTGITAKMPEHIAGVVDAEVISPTNQKAVLIGVYTYQ
jgi:hypothetical protein